MNNRNKKQVGLANRLAGFVLVILTGFFGLMSTNSQAQERDMSGITVEYSLPTDSQPAMLRWTSKPLGYYTVEKSSDLTNWSFAGFASGPSLTPHLTDVKRSWRGTATSYDGTKLVGIANNSNIWTSQNSGTTWLESLTSGVRAWSCVASSMNGGKIVAGVNGGYIYASLNSGLTWVQCTSSGVRVWVGIASSADGTRLVAAAQNDYIYVSTDSGNTWSRCISIGSRYWTAIASDATGLKLLALANGGSRYRSVDGGITWVRIPNPLDGVVDGVDYTGSYVWLSAASSTDGTKLISITHWGEVWMSTDGGVNWKNPAASGGQGMSSISADATCTNIVALGDWRSRVFVSEDSMNTGSLSSGTFNPYRFISASISGNGCKIFVAESNGYLYTSNLSANEMSFEIIGGKADGLPKEFYRLRKN